MRAFQMFSILPPWNWWKPWHSILTWTDNGQISANSFLFWNDIALLQNMQAVAAAARLLYVIVKQIMQIYCKINSHTTKKKRIPIQDFSHQKSAKGIAFEACWALLLSSNTALKMGTRGTRSIVWYEKPPPILNFLHEEFLPSWKFHLSF